AAHAPAVDANLGARAGGRAREVALEPFHRDEDHDVPRDGATRREPRRRLDEVEAALPARRWNRTRGGDAEERRPRLEHVADPRPLRVVEPEDAIAGGRAPGDQRRRVIDRAPRRRGDGPAGFVTDRAAESLLVRP